MKFSSRPHMERPQNIENVFYRLKIIYKLRILKTSVFFPFTCYRSDNATFHIVHDPGLSEVISQVQDR